MDIQSKKFLLVKELKHDSIIDSLKEQGFEPVLVESLDEIEPVLNQTSDQERIKGFIPFCLVRYKEIESIKSVNELEKVVNPNLKKDGILKAFSNGYLESFVNQNNYKVTFTEVKQGFCIAYFSKKETNNTKESKIESVEENQSSETEPKKNNKKKKELKE